MRKLLRGIMLILSFLWAAGMILMLWYRSDGGEIYRLGSSVTGFIRGNWELTQNRVSGDIFFFMQAAFIGGLAIMFIGKKKILPVIFGMLISVGYLVMSYTCCYQLIQYLAEDVLVVLVETVVGLLNRLVDLQAYKLINAAYKLDSAFSAAGAFFASMMALITGLMYLTGRAADKRKKMKEDEERDEYAYAARAMNKEANRYTVVTAPKAETTAYEAAEKAAEAVKEAAPVRAAESVVVEIPVPAAEPVEAEIPAPAVEPAMEEIPVQAEAPAEPALPIEEVKPAVQSVRREDHKYDPDAMNRLRKLADLYRMGILSEEEFSEKKREILRKV